MCGIAGIVHFDGRSPSSEKVEGMIRLLAHRGPDGERTWSCPEAALGHARLRIIDLSPASDQPFLSEDGKTALVYNGEVYNYRELRTELASRGHVFRTAGDTEVVLRAYEAAGPACRMAERDAERRRTAHEHLRCGRRARGEDGVPGGRTGYACLRIASTETWFQHFLDRRVGPPQL